MRVHRIDPVLAVGNAPLIPRLGGLVGFDVLHLHYPFIFGSELALIARARRRGRAQALLVHYKNRLVADRGVRVALFEAYEHSVGPLLVRAADRVCVLSADHASSVSYLRRTAAREPQKLIEMPNGVDAELFRPRRDEGARERLGLPAAAFVFAFVATLDRAHHFKRLDLAIDALARLAQTPRPAHLLVAGAGELLDGFRARARDAGVADRVRFLGAVPHEELPEVLSCADAFLLATEPPESFGIVLIEAMACGLPAIATDYPGVRAVIDDETGVLVPRGDVEAVAAAMSRFAGAAPEALGAMGDAARAKAVREWSWPQLLERMDRAYAEAIAARREKLAR